MEPTTIVLATVVITALMFDFTNGFHDTANAMATSIVTGALKPKVAVVLSAVLNFAGALLSLSVAATIAKGIVHPEVITLNVVFAGLVGGIMWNLVTWYFGIPSSSSHALVGGVVGAALVAIGPDAVLFTGVIAKVIIPALLAPVAAGLVAATGTVLVYRITRNIVPNVHRRGFRIGQIASASMVSLAHGTNDAQKTMGIITLALVAHGSLSMDSNPPMWVILSCAFALAMGTYLGGWRVIRTMGKGLVEIEPPQGFAAQSSSAAVILTASHFGFPLSTTHVSTGSVVGSGLGRRSARIRWSLFGTMAVAWLVTLPAAGLVGALAWEGADLIGGAPGVAVVFVIAALISLGLYIASRRQPITADNVNDVWEGAKPTDVETPIGVG